MNHYHRLQEIDQVLASLERRIHELRAKYQGVRPGWVSADIGSLVAHQRALLRERERLLAETPDEE